MSWRRTVVAPAGTHHLIGGAPLYEARFDEVLKFHAPGLAPVRAGGEAWHIDATGAAAYARRFARTFGFYEGRAAVVSPDGWHHIDAAGDDVYGERHAWCGNFQGGRCAVRDAGGSYAHIDEAGRPVYERRWRYAGDYRDGIAVVQAEDGRSTHIDANGHPLHDRWFVDLDVFHKNFARARDADGWTHVDRAGRPGYAGRFAMVEPFYNGQARVERFDGALEVIDESGRTVAVLRPATRDEFHAPSADRFDSGRGVGPVVDPGGAGVTRRREREPADASVTSSPRNAAIQPFPPVPGDRPVALLVRHAERPPLPVGESGDHVSLTPAGIAQARALGATLGTRLRCVWTSPIRRCRETSEHLRAGCNQQVDIRDDTLLGDPGVFVIDAALAWTNWQRLGNEGVIEHLMSGDGALPGMREPIAAAMLLLERVAGALSGPAGVHVFITHDAVLAPWIARMFGDRLDRASWPRFLDGAAVWRSRRGLHVRYRDREEIRP